MITTNLPSGYHRDLQLVKESLLPAIEDVKACLSITDFMLKQVIVKDGILEQDIYQYLFSVEVVNELVLKGVPFREAYKQVGEQIAAGTFSPDKEVSHSHEGSIGNLCTEEIKAKKDQAMTGFGFEGVKAAWTQLLDK